MLWLRQLLALAWTPILLAAGPALPGVHNLSQEPVNPFASGRVTVLLFVRSDCPISKRYAPELHRISELFRAQPVRFWLVFPDPAETAQDVTGTLSQFSFPGTPVLDPKHALVRVSHATVAPEAAVFNAAGALQYHGRIDDLYVDIGKSHPVAQVHDLQDAIHAVLAGRSVAHPETPAIGCSLADIQ